MSLSCKRIRQQIVVTAYKQLVYEVESCNPIAVLHLTVTVLVVILTSGKIPHEISPVHEVDLIPEEELKVFGLCGHGNLNIFAS